MGNIIGSLYGLFNKKGYKINYPKLELIATKERLKLSRSDSKYDRDMSNKYHNLADAAHNKNDQDIFKIQDEIHQISIGKLNSELTTTENKYNNLQEKITNFKTDYTTKDNQPPIEEDNDYKSAIDTSNHFIEQINTLKTNLETLTKKQSDIKKVMK